MSWHRDLGNMDELEKKNTLVTGWQGMDTAPLDGTDVLVLVNSAGQAVVHMAWYDAKEDQCWFYYKNSVSQIPLVAGRTPIAWSPLPTLPENL